MADDIPRKTSQEYELDNLLAEEFATDPGFLERFLKAGGITDSGATVIDVISQPSLGGNGFGDLLVLFHHLGIDGLPSALLIEDKISAGAAVRQAERYREFAEGKVGREWRKYWMVLVAPARYVGETRSYDLKIDIEIIIDIIDNASQARLNYRRNILRRAINKSATSGVKIPDPLMHKLQHSYREFINDWSCARGIGLIPPRPRSAYYDGDSWVKIAIQGHDDILLRHRLWTDQKSKSGQIDLIVDPVTPEREAIIRSTCPPGSVCAPYGKGRGIAIYLSLPEMRQTDGFDPQLAQLAIDHACKLLYWYATRVVPDAKLAQALSAIPA